MKKVLVLFMVLAILAGFPFTARADSGETAEIYDLMVNDMVSPPGLDDPTPTFSWKMRSGVIGQRQTAYRITVQSGGETVWDSGRVESDRCFGILYDGEALASSSDYTWQVQVWDKDGKEAVSQTAFFSMALLEEDAFADTHFISYDTANDPADFDAAGMYHEPAYRKSITVEPGLVSARLYTAGLGVYESYINGRRVGRLVDGEVQYDELKPGFTQRNLRQFYSAFDVTWMLTEGENVLGAVVTNGWWKGVGSVFRGKENAYLAKLILSYADGTQTVVVTDTTWRSARYGGAFMLPSDHYAIQGKYRETGIYAGERFDATVDQSWMQPGYDDSAWGNAKVNTEFSGVLEAWKGVPITVRQDLELTPRSLTVYKGVTGNDGNHFGDIHVTATYTDGQEFTLPAGSKLVVDFGQNFAGWEYLEVKGARGTEVRIEHAEALNETGGSLSRHNTGPGGSLYERTNRSATANTIYILSGGDPAVDGGFECYHPSFSFYGFQYMELSATADITIRKIRGQVVSSAQSDTATMVTSDASVNQLLSNIRWGMLSNYLAVPTDCPQRDERHGWTGDAQVFSQAGTYLTYAKSFLTKYMQDLRDGQSLSYDGDTYNSHFVYTEENQGKDFFSGHAGAYPDIAPLVNNYVGMFDEVGWGDAGIIVPWTLYMMYGDATVLEAHWQSMTQYMEHLSKVGGKGLDNGAKDHLSPEKNSGMGEFLGVCYYAWDALMMVDMAQALGKPEAAAHYRGVYEEQKALFQERWVHKSGVLQRGEQTAYLYALYLDLVPEEYVENVIGQLVESLEEHGGTMQTGFLGTSVVTKALTKAGRSDLAYDLLLTHEYPSWLYSVDQGATTMWERWDTYTLENGWYDPEVSTMNSMNHYAYGAVAGWMYETLAGIGYDRSNPGFKNIILAPAFDSRLPDIQSSYESVFGLIQTSTHICDGKTVFTATIPANTTASARIPVAEGQVLTVNGKALSDLTLETDGLRYEKTENGIACFEAVAGSFTFTLAGPTAPQAEAPAQNSWLLPAALGGAAILLVLALLLVLKKRKSK